MKKVKETVKIPKETKEMSTSYNLPVGIKYSSAGITLIALVITIIVILILAGVTIATLTGENGILNQASKAKTSDSEGEAKDKFALVANEWAIEKNTSNKTLGEFLNEKLKEGKLTSIEDNGYGTYNIKLNGYQTIIDQNGKISSVFNPEEWDKTATTEDCFVWGSDTQGEDGYNVIIGYTEKLESYSKARIPSRCKKIICDGSYYDNNQYSDEQIGRAFFSNIEKIEIPNTVVEIGPYAFGNLHGIKILLKEIIIPNSVISIGYNAFIHCSNLTSIEIPDSIISIGNSAFYDTAWYNNQPDGLVYAGKVAYKYKGTMPENTAIAIKEGSKGIGDSAFFDCENLTSVTIPDSVTNIERQAFWGCRNLTSITIPNSVTSMGSNVFYNWTSFQTINIKGYTSVPSGWDIDWNSGCLATINWRQ